MDKEKHDWKYRITGNSETPWTQMPKDLQMDFSPTQVAEMAAKLHEAAIMVVSTDATYLIEVKDGFNGDVLECQVQMETIRLATAKALRLRRTGY